VFLVSIFVYYK